MAKDINKLFNEALEILDSLNIRVETISSVKWNPRFRTTWGMCYRKNNIYRIELNPILNEEEVSWEMAMDTMIHEVLHAHKDRFCHTGEWKRCANRINTAYPIYHITRCTSAEEKNIANKMSTINYKYIIKCSGCGHEYKYQRTSKVVRLVQKNSNSCKCGVCGSTQLNIRSC